MGSWDVPAGGAVADTTCCQLGCRDRSALVWVAYMIAVQFSKYWRLAVQDQGVSKFGFQ